MWRSLGVNLTSEDIPVVEALLQHLQWQKGSQTSASPPRWAGRGRGVNTVPRTPRVLKL